MLDGLVFGWHTAILLPSMLVMGGTAAALFGTLTNRIANKVLAWLLVILVGILTPWAIGFAGFYDRWPWLSFAPFANPLAVAPLFYFYVHALMYARLPARPFLHLAPALLMFVFQTGSFLLPFGAKMRWAALVSEPSDVVVAIGIAVGFAFYGRACWDCLSDYRCWLASHRSDDDRFAGRWVMRAFIGASLLLLIWSLYQTIDALTGLSYRGLMGLYVAIAAFGALLALEGWRHAHLVFPTIRASETDADMDSPQTRDWYEEGQAWSDRIRSDRLFEDPALSLARAARHLATNQTYLSRAVNEGLGVNWSTLINRMRSDAVAERLTQENKDSDILALALDCGFNSKASFNRVFREHYGMTPSAYRKMKSQKP